MASRRIEWVDVAKGIGIILVIVGHCVHIDGFWHRLIFAFHMPLFFVLSGLFFKEQAWGTFCLKKARQLLVPYVAFCVVGMLYTVLCPFAAGHLSLAGMKKDIILGYPNSINVSSIWFLVCLFMTMCMLNAVCRLGKSHRLASGALLVLAVTAGFWFGSHNELAASLPYKRLPLDLDSACVALLFLWIGHQFRDDLLATAEECMALSRVKRMACLVLYAFLVVLVIRANGRVNLHGLMYRNWYLFVVGAILGTILVVIASCGICTTELGKRAFTWLGRNSLMLMGVQAIVLRLYLQVANEYMGKSLRLYHFPPKHALVSTVFCCAVSILLVALYNYCRTHLIKPRD